MFIQYIILNSIFIKYTALLIRIMDKLESDPHASLQDLRRLFPNCSNSMLANIKLTTESMTSITP